MLYLFKVGFIDITFLDIVDVLLVSLLIYQLYKLLTGSIAVKIFGGLLSLYLLYLLVKAAHMQLLTAILGQFIGVGVLALMIVFQQEIRKFLLLIGKNALFNKSISGFRFFWQKNTGYHRLDLSQVIEAVKSMAGSNTGGILVFSRSTPMKFFAESGDSLDAIVSKRLILSIFNKYSPLHDGAVIIFEDRIKAARCILPVSENTDIPATHGLRHRAALGMSELTDAVAVVVSEESGQISLAFNGKMGINLSSAELRSQLITLLFERAPALQTEENIVEKKVYG
ncbi:MAG: TIGR00159 family protein [Bacteroidetes bacterium RIFCSPLOWO2_02_FULL_36_8]|nr:MAG: TIGR00159 family protein [Bacteroidetes bacterium RIFCSPLOWO2_02_FULL_36_8]OFY70638.1 MAG: TIGR00159 family protein [Bacteroidetes bacterium RIFCSPLOWO2_12_FULL_37_12]